MKHHPAAEMFPLLEGDRLQELVDSMKSSGFDKKQPILRLNGEILDGRNRYVAAKLAGVQPVFADVDPTEDPFEVSWRYNGARRDISQMQRAAIGVSLRRHSAEWLLRQDAAAGRMSPGENQHTRSVTTSSQTSRRPPTREEFVRELGVNQEAVQLAMTAAKLKDSGEEPQLLRDLVSGVAGVTEGRRRIRQAQGKPPTPPPTTSVRKTGPVGENIELVQRMRELEDSDEGAQMPAYARAAAIGISYTKYENLKNTHLRQRVNPLHKATEGLEEKADLTHFQAQYDRVHERCEPEELEAFRAAVNQLLSNVKKLKENTK